MDTWRSVGLLAWTGSLASFVHARLHLARLHWLGPFKIGPECMLVVLRRGEAGEEAGILRGADHLDIAGSGKKG